MKEGPVDSQKPYISNKRKYLEIISVLLTGIGKIVFMDLLNWRLPFISIAMIGWVFYISYCYKMDHRILSYWGFRKDNFIEAVKIFLPFGAGSIILFLIIGILNKSLMLTWHIIPVLLIYPIWGTIQQFLVIGLFGGNLNELKGVGIKKSAIVFLTAVLFGVVHYPHYWLIAVTFVLALLYGYVYLKVRNVYAMGLFHGWLGALFYYTVLNRDPFIEVFGKFI